MPWRASRAEGCVVIVEEVSQVEVRFANNTTTTNGVRRDRRVAVVSFARWGATGARGSPVGRGRGQPQRRGRRGGARAGQRGRGRGEPPRPTTPRRLIEPTGSTPAGPTAAEVGAATRRSTSRHRRRHRPCSAGSSRSRGRLRPGPGGRQHPGGVRHTRASRPSTWARAPGSGSATSNRPGSMRARGPQRRRNPLGLGRHGHRSTFDDIDVAAFEARLDRRLAWAAAPRRAARRALRGAPPPRRHRRPHGADVGGHVGPGRRGRPQSLLGPGGRDQDRRAAVPAAVRTARRPGRSRASSRRRSW